MPAWLKSTFHGLRYGADSVLTGVCWILWLALGGLLAIQAGIAVSHELAVPGFVLRAFESRFAAAHIDARFGRAVFDPTGRLLVENLQLSLPGFEEPAVRARAVFVELNPWLLAAGRFEVRRVRATGVDLFVPAMLAPSGQTEKSLADLDLDVAPGDDDIAIDQLCAQVAGVALDVHGTVQLPARRTEKGATPLSLLQEAAKHYADFSRQVIRASEALKAFKEPAVHVLLQPSPTRGAVARVQIGAQAASWPQLHGLAIAGLNASIRLPLLGGPPAISPVRVTFDEARFDDIVVHDGRAWIRGSLNAEKFFYAPHETRLALREIAARGFALDAVSVRVTPGPLPRVAAELVAACAGEALALNGRADLAQKTAAVHAAGALSPDLLQPIGAAIGRELRAFVGLGEPLMFDVSANFGAGWKFRDLAGRVSARRLDARGVPMDRIGGEITFDGNRFVARHAIAVVGENVARGTFEQDVHSREYRFLLEGRLRPLEIAPWFHDWWEHIFTAFAFPTAAPAASVDVRGRWHAPHESEVFVAADAAGAAIRDVRFDRLRTLLFIRPNFIDGLEVFGKRDAAEVRGTFVRNIDVEAKEWRDMDFALTSSFPLQDAEQLLGAAIADELEPFTFERPPQVKVSGHVDGPGVTGERHHALDIAAESKGAFSVYQFPGRDLAFTAKLRDHDLALPHVEATVASGRLAGSAHLWGDGQERRLSFDAKLAGADLASTVSTVSNYKALRRGQPPPAEGNYFSGKASAKLDLALKAEGNFSDLFSYRGSGSAAISGPELGEVRLLGLLSELLSFTALRFTAVHGDFKLDGPKLTFPAVSATGRNSAIEAHGTYALDRDALDFNARVFPFQESKSLLNVVGAVLTPLSTALEVKLTGPLAQPHWAFVIGPTNLLRSLAQPNPSGDNEKPDATKTPPPKQP